MPDSSVTFADLPEAVRQAVTRQTGPVRSIRPVETSRPSVVTAILATQGGPIFVKGIPADQPQAVAHCRETRIAPHLPPLAPRLLWHVKTAGWLVVAWEAVAGRRADYHVPADLQMVRTALEKVQSVQAPAEVKTAVDRWGPYADDGAAELFDGDVLLHTNLVPGNVLLAGRQVYLVDWRFPTRGAGWVDAYLWALRLMEAGHSAASAVSWACELPSWRDADPRAIGAFGAVVQRVWHEAATKEPAARTLHLAVQAAELRAYLALELGAADC